MELVNRQDVLKAIDDVLMEDEQYKVWMKLSIKNIKPVDAIPVSFIQQRIYQLQDIADFALDSNGGYIESANSSLYELKLLLSRWKAEQSAKDK